MNKYKKLEKIVDDYARAYNYNYDSSFDKHYAINNDNITFYINSSSKEAIVEIASLGFNLLNESGIDCFLELPESDATKVLDYLEVAYENGDSYQYYSDDNTLGKISVNVDSIILKLDTNVILEYIDSDDEALEVNIIASSSEELFKAMILMQDLRLSGVITDLNKDNAKINIKLNDEKLSKGLITVEDVLVKEETIVPEDEIIEYILGIV